MKNGILAAFRNKTINIIIFAFVFILAALAFGARKNMDDLRRLRGIKQELIHENLMLVDKNQALRDERSALHTPEYLERVARDNFGLIKPDEMVFVVEEPRPYAKGAKSGSKTEAHD